MNTIANLDVIQDFIGHKKSLQNWSMHKTYTNERDKGFMARTLRDILSRIFKQYRL